MNRGSSTRSAPSVAGVALPDEVSVMSRTTLRTLCADAQAWDGKIGHGAVELLRKRAPTDEQGAKLQASVAPARETVAPRRLAWPMLP